MAMRKGEPFFARFDTDAAAALAAEPTSFPHLRYAATGY
jgi:hypothetical protein